MIHYNLTSHIVLNKVSENLYHPKTAVERSELTRFEKIRTDIFPKSEDAVDNIADAIEREIKDKAQENAGCAGLPSVLWVGGGAGGKQADCHSECRPDLGRALFGSQQRGGLVSSAGRKERKPWNG